MIRVWKSSDELHRGDHPMHDVLIALAFIGMVVAPAVVAAKSGTSESKIN
jgi:uncharacterized protein YraI